MTFPPYITRDFIRAAPNVLFIYADDMTQMARKGQAAECEGEPNAMCVPTREWNCSIVEAQFKDSLFEQIYREDIDYFVNPIITRLKLQPHMKPYILPKIGRGCSNMVGNAPRCYSYLLSRLREIDPQYKG